MNWNRLPPWRMWWMSIIGVTLRELAYWLVRTLQPWMHAWKHAKPSRNICLLWAGALACRHIKHKLFFDFQHSVLRRGRLTYMSAKEEDRFSRAVCFHSKQGLNQKQTNVIHKGLAALHCNKIPDKNLGSNIFIHTTCKHHGLTQGILVNFRRMAFDIIILYLNQLYSFAIQSKLGVCHSSRLKKHFRNVFMLAFVSSIFFSIASLSNIIFSYFAQECGYLLTPVTSAAERPFAT